MGAYKHWPRFENEFDSADKAALTTFDGQNFSVHGSGLTLPICLVKRSDQVKPKNEANIPNPAQNHSQFTFGQLSEEIAGAFEINDITVPLVLSKKTV
ncbi:MAG TPA: hypothetical protein VGN23_01130 [Verrucomicrobiae bacterium]